jgi:hypothetical protein
MGQAVAGRACEFAEERRWRRGIKCRGLPANAAGSQTPCAFAPLGERRGGSMVGGRDRQATADPYPRPCNMNLPPDPRSLPDRQAVGALSSIYQYGVPSAADSPLGASVAFRRRWVPSPSVRRPTLQWPSGPITMTLSIAHDCFQDRQARFKRPDGPICFFGLIPANEDKPWHKRKK